MPKGPDFDWYLTDWMASLDVTQAALCRATGFSKAKMSELVNGISRYNRDVVNSIADAMHVRPYELLMHPDDANAIRRMRETAVKLAAESPPLTNGRSAKIVTFGKSEKKL